MLTDNTEREARVAPVSAANAAAMFRRIVLGFSYTLGGLDVSSFTSVILTMLSMKAGNDSQRLVVTDGDQQVSADAESMTVEVSRFACGGSERIFLNFPPD